MLRKLKKLVCKEPAAAADASARSEDAQASVYKSGDGGAQLYLHLQAQSRSAPLNQERSLEEIAANSVASAPAPVVAASVSKQANAAIKQQSERVRQKRVMTELRDIQESHNLKSGVFSVALADDNLFEWDVKLYKFDPDSLLARGLAHMSQSHGIDNVWIRISFQSNYPFSPPFVRVIAPFVQGGFVLSGGAICLELLTPDGWSQACTTEAIIMETMVAMVKGKSRIVSTVAKVFSEEEAQVSYDYLVKTHARHGWENN